MGPRSSGINCESSSPTRDYATTTARPQDLLILQTTLRWGLTNSRPTPHNHYNDNTRDPAPPAIVYQSIQRLHSYPDRTSAPFLLCPAAHRLSTALQIPDNSTGSSTRAYHAHSSELHLAPFLLAPAFQTLASRTGSSNRACHAHQTATCSVPAPFRLRSCSVPAPFLLRSGSVPARSSVPDP